MKKALITGITGQDGSYLTELLLAKGYEVHGIIRRASTFNTERIDHLYTDPHVNGVRLFLHYGDIADSTNLIKLLYRIQPEEVYHLAAQSHVRVSFDIPEYTGDVTGLSAVRILEAIRETGVPARVYQASSSEMFGKVREVPQRETTPFHPRSPYGAAKAYAYWIATNYRESYGMFVCNGILFNHESPRRGETFVTRKITRAVARIKAGLQDKLYLGNLEAQRDWGYAKEYCVNRDVPILTVDGWKFCHEIEEGQEIINFDPAKNCLSRDRVLKKIELVSSGEKIVFEGRGLYLNVTPDHRVFYQSKSKSSKGGWSAWKVATARELCRQMHDKSERTKYDYRLPHFQDYAAPDLPQVTDDQLYLVGALLAEGWLNQARAVNGGAYVAIGQSMFANERVALQIKEAIHTLGLRGRESSKNDGMVEWVFNADDSKRILSWFDTLNLHVMPRYFYSLSRRQSEIVFRAMMDCDGCWSSMTYHSKRYLLAVDFQTIAHLAGYRTSQLRSRPDGSYEVNVIVKRKKHTYFQQVSEQSDGQQEVWCVQTRNGTIITRDHDCLSISGNCEAMWLMLQQDEPDDYVVGTGETHSVREFLSAAFERAGLDWQKYVEIDPQYYRPAEVDLLVADASKAERKLGWRPQTTFRELVSLMVDADIAALRGNQSQGATNVSVGK